MTRQEFIKKIAPLVVKYAPQYNVLCPSAVIAQAVLESDGGNSELAKNANNYFGLKYRKGRCPTASGSYKKVGSEQNKDGSYTSSMMTWMKFKTMEDGVRGYFDFTNINNYKAIKNVKDPKTYLENIKKAGYATSIKYVDNVYAVIQRYNLTQYDPVDFKFTNSSLVSYTKISPNKTSPRNHEIDTLTIHCMAGNLSVETCGNVFAPTSRQASSNYGIGSDGRIAMYVEEKDRSWCSSNAANDNRAITIEVANDGGAPDWHVSDKAMESLINLCVDICKRNNIKELKWQDDKKLIGQVDKQNMTIHSWFSNKSCPGAFLHNQHPYIVQEVNKRLGKKIISPVSKINQSKKDIQKFLNKYYGTQIKKVIGALLDVDGDIGAKSKKAIAIAIQVELNKLGAGIDIDGSFGANTAKAFDKYVGTLMNGSNNIFVMLWQCLLVGYDINPNGIDSSFGGGCLAATKKLFAKLKLPNDSTVSGADLNKIL